MTKFEIKLQIMSLPKTAKQILPSSLSTKTKVLLGERRDMELIILTAIQKIENGSVKTLEELIEKDLMR
ncbi:MAG: hypothetical protein IKH38_03140 [Clostridia bacterium]|nr:hypothetical protein [Clostridia bacterium]